MDLVLPELAPLSVKSSIQISPLTSTCKIPFEAREHICFGISPFNSLFTEEYIASLITWGLHNFKNVSLFLPDEPTFYTLEALGYAEDECRRKMKKQLNWLKNKINKALAINGLCPNRDIILLDWTALTSHQTFNSQLEEVYELFDSDQEFRNSCLEASRWVLQNKLSESEMTERALLKAVKYFLAEIPLFSSTNRIVGSKTSLFCYHQSTNFHRRLYNRELKLIPSLGHGYGIIETIYH